MSLLLNGEYTIKKGRQIICSKNSIQSDGFSLVRDWFVSQRNQFDLIDLTDASIISHNIDSNNLSDVKVLFYGNKDGFAYISETSANFKVKFVEKQYLYAIGIDVIHKTVNGKNINANMLLSYNWVQTNDVAQMNFTQLDLQPLPVAYFNQGDVTNSRQVIYYFNDPLYSNCVKIDFNKFSEAKIDYEIRAINFYTKKNKICPPQRISLYDANGECLISKTIENRHSYMDSNSIVYKTNLQFGELDSTQDEVYAISTDYFSELDHKWHMFSYSQFQYPWMQQELQIIQLQYQLTFGSIGVMSSTSNSSDSSF